MAKCFICGNEAKHSETINVVTCECDCCGSYAYEKNFLTTYEYYFSVNNSQKRKKTEEILKEFVKKHKVCFVDDFETSLVIGYDLIELRDILNMVGYEFTHNNTIDSNWTD